MKKIFVRLLSTIVIVSLLISCNKDDETYNYQTPTEQGDSNNSSNDNEEEDNLTQIISQNVFVSVKYQNYGWKITGYTSLNSILSGHDIRYGIICGYTDITDKYFYRYIDDIGYNIDFTETIFIDINKDPYTTLYLYWCAYMELIEMSNLSQSQQELFNEVVTTMNRYEYEIKSKYWGRLFVEIDGIQYIIKSFGVRD